MCEIIHNKSKDVSVELVSVGIQKPTMDLPTVKGTQVRANFYANLKVRILHPFINTSAFLFRDEEDGSFVITREGFQFLLMDTPSQVWYFLLQYLSTVNSRGLSLAECLTFLFQLSFSSLGKVLYTTTPTYFFYVWRH